MALFNYNGRNANGEPVSGQLKADSADAAATLLMQQHVTPIEINPTKIDRDIIQALRARFSKKKVDKIDLMFFCRQMHTLLKAGVPILSALKNLATAANNKDLQTAIQEVHDELSSGQELSVALRQHGDIFPPLFASIIAVGEASGSLDISFQLLANYIDKERELNNNIRSALRYPMIVIAVIAIAMVIINMMVIPAFANIFKSFNTELPLMTRILIGTSDIFLQYWPALLLGIVVTYTVVKSYLKTERGRWQWHGYKIKLPLIGDIIFKAILGRFTSTLAICIKAGMPWQKTFDIAGKTADNDVIAAKINDIGQHIEQGMTITQASSESSMFPPLVIQMIQVGEQTGSIDTLITEVSEFYEQEVAYKVKTLNDALEPIILWIVGMLVLVLALGVFLPMWDLGGAAMAGS